MKKIKNTLLLGTLLVSVAPAYGMQMPSAKKTVCAVAGVTVAYLAVQYVYSWWNAPTRTNAPAQAQPQGVQDELAQRLAQRGQAVATHVSQGTAVESAPDEVVRHGSQSDVQAQRERDRQLAREAAERRRSAQQ